MRPHRKARERGIALVTAIAFTFVVLALGVALLGLTTSELVASKSQADTIVARSAAEAGAEIALNQWNSGIKPATLTGSTQALVDGANVVVGSYTVQCVEDTNHVLTITSVGADANAATGVPGQTVRITAAGQTAEASAFPFQFGAFAKESMILASPKTDSWDSAKGPQNAQAPGKKGGVGTNSSVTGAIKISGGPNLNGTVAAGMNTVLVKTAPGWSNPPPEGILPGWGTQYQGGYPKGVPAFTVLPKDVDLPDIVPPVNGIPFGYVPVIVDLAKGLKEPSGVNKLVSARQYDQKGNSKNNNFTWDIPAGTYNLTSIEMPSDENVVNINGDVTFVVSGIVKTGGNTKFRFAPGASLKIIVSGKVDIGASFTNMNGSAPLPANVQLQGTPGCAEIKYSGNVAFTGTIYAPSSKVIFGGSSNIFGAVVGRIVEITGGGWIHYDEQLANVGIGEGSDEADKWTFQTWEQL